MNVSCVHPMVCGDSQVSTNIVSSGQVQLTVMCTNPKCLSSSVSLRSIDLLRQNPVKVCKSATYSRKSYLSLHVRRYLKLSDYRIVENFRGRKLSRILRSVVICESFLCKILGCGILWCGRNKQSAKVFSLESFPLYGSK